MSCRRSEVFTCSKIDLASQYISTVVEIICEASRRMDSIRTFVFAKVVCLRSLFGSFDIADEMNKTEDRKDWESVEH
jgi:hypothetical protein